MKPIQIVEPDLLDPGIGLRSAGLKKRPSEHRGIQGQLGILDVPANRSARPRVLDDQIGMAAPPALEELSLGHLATAAQELHELHPAATGERHLLVVDDIGALGELKHERAVSEVVRLHTTRVLRCERLPQPLEAFDPMIGNPVPLLIRTPDQETRIVDAAH